MAATDIEALPAGREAWQQALRERLADPGTSCCLYSADYADWPLHEAAVVAALEAWALTRRQPCLRMLARRYDGLIRTAPRFVDWRARFAHLIECRELPDGVDEPAEGLLLAHDGVVAKAVEHGRAGFICRGAAWLAATQRWDAAWERSHPAFAAYTLGL
ncbi:hypothetical protein GALL_265440 [mine drainage metagenome]|jgi:hypothetical protein|uniref:DUF7931 domain-containing protein n=1 Tax=mine drainage metagenome TaxID=410659 RepID=A0A1J5RU04_9ZZZZ